MAKSKIPTKSHDSHRQEYRHSQDVILDSIADGVFTVDGDWRITSFNRAAERITGVSRREATGRRCCDVFRASICENACALKKTLDTGTPIVNQSVYIVDAEGRRIPISISTAILRDESDNVIGGVETFRDLSTVEELRKELTGRYTFADIIGRSPAMRQIFDILPRLAESDSTALITGPSGTGKELVARAIHNLSPRREGTFVAVNCGALPESLLESELFGHKAGAFTGASKDRDGRFAAAEGGTILLDEIGDISLAMQVRLLRVLQEKTFEPLGSNEPISADVRVIAATHRDLDELVARGEFRQDLFYRVNVVRLDLPALSERREDIPLLVEHFVDNFNRRQGRAVAGLNEEAMAIILAHEYPGNVRELENIIEHAFVLCTGSLIEPKHLPASLCPSSENHSAGRADRATLGELEAMHIAEALRRNDGNRSAAARELGINPSTLFRKLKAADKNGKNT